MNDITFGPLSFLGSMNMVDETLPFGKSTSSLTYMQLWKAYSEPKWMEVEKQTLLGLMELVKTKYVQELTRMSSPMTL